MATYSGIYLHFEGTVSEADATQQARELVYVSSSGTMRYKTAGGSYVYLSTEPDASGSQTNISGSQYFVPVWTSSGTFTESSIMESGSSIRVNFGSEVMSLDSDGQLTLSGADISLSGGYVRFNSSGTLESVTYDDAIPFLRSKAQFQGTDPIPFQTGPYVPNSTGLIQDIVEIANYLPQHDQRLPIYQKRYTQAGITSAMEEVFINDNCSAAYCWDFKTADWEDQDTLTSLLKMGWQYGLNYTAEGDILSDSPFGSTNHIAICRLAGDVYNSDYDITGDFTPARSGVNGETSLGKYIVGARDKYFYNSQAFSTIETTAEDDWYSGHYPSRMTFEIIPSGSVLGTALTLGKTYDIASYHEDQAEMRTNVATRYVELANSGEIAVGSLFGGLVAGILVTTPDHEQTWGSMGAFFVTTQAADHSSYLIQAHSNAADTDTPGSICVYDNGSTVMLKNNLGGTIQTMVTLIGSVIAV